MVRPRPCARTALIAFLMGFLPSADDCPTSAPTTPPITAPTGPPITPPATAPVIPPAVCFETGGRFSEELEFFAIWRSAGQPESGNRYSQPYCNISAGQIETVVPLLSSFKPELCIRPLRTRPWLVQSSAADRPHELSPLGYGAALTGARRASRRAGTRVVQESNLRQPDSWSGALPVELTTWSSTQPSSQPNRGTRQCQSSNG